MCIAVFFQADIPGHIVGHILCIGMCVPYYTGNAAWQPHVSCNQGALPQKYWASALGPTCDQGGRYITKGLPFLGSCIGIIGRGVSSR